MGVRRGKARDSGSVGRGRHVEDWYKSAFIMMIGQRFFVKEFIGVWIADWNVGTPQTIESLLERRNKPHPDTKIACITEGDRETNDLTDTATTSKYTVASNPRRCKPTIAHHPQYPSLR
jgi:hypothetical protein